MRRHDRDRGFEKGGAGCVCVCVECVECVGGVCKIHALVRARACACGVKSIVVVGGAHVYTEEGRPIHYRSSSSWFVLK